MRLPEAIFLQTVTGDYPDDQSAMNPSDIDIVLRADPKTVRVCPGRRSPPPRSFTTASTGMAGRSPWRLGMYCGASWTFTKRMAGNRWWRRNSSFPGEPNIDSDYPLKPRGPLRQARDRAPGIQHCRGERVRSPLDDMYSFCEAQDIEIDTLIHESGAAQMEINLLHGYPMSLADQAFLSSAPREKRPCATKCTPLSWPNRWPRSPAAPCICIRASSMPRRARTSSATPMARRPRCSSTYRGLQKYLPAPCPCLHPT